MIKWSFKPTLSLIDLVLIFIWAEFLIPTMGLWSLIPFIGLMILIDKVEQTTWEVLPFNEDEDEPEGICEYQADLELVIPYLREMALRGDDEAMNLLMLIGESNDR